MTVADHLQRLEPALAEVLLCIRQADLPQAERAALAASVAGVFLRHAAHELHALSPGDCSPIDIARELAAMAVEQMAADEQSPDTIQ